MSNIKIEQYDGSDIFTFPYNPNTVDFSTAKFVDKKNLPYSFTFLGFTSPLKSSVDIGLNGHFDGATKNSDYRSLVKKINTPEFVKLYFENNYNRFYLCTGINIQKVYAGTRPLHLDYVASFFSPFGILFDDDQQSGSSSSTNSNDGDIVTPIEKITGEVVSGTDIKIQDKNGNGFQFKASRSGTMTYHIVKVTSEDNTTYLTEYGYVDIEGDRQTVRNADTSGDIFLKLEEGESLVDIFSSGSISGITPTFYFRNGWASD